MCIFEFEPYKKVGLLEFGMNRNQVRKIMGEYSEFKKSKFSKNSADNFGDCHAFYTQDNIFQALEIFNDAQLVFDNKNIFDFDFQILKSFILDLDSNLQLSGNSVISKVLGLSIYVPNGNIESVLVFREGYYNK